MSEFIIIQVGQCGNQIGSALWPLILQEYNINPNSNPQIKNVDITVQKSFSSFFNTAKKDINFETFTELLNNKVKARAVCIDMEDSVVARFNNGSLRGLFDKKCIVTNYPGSGNNWAEGYYGHGPIYKEKILKAIKHAVERCDSLHGFLLLFSTGGGTGSGLGTFVLNLLSDYYPEIERFAACVYPIGTEDVITCPYNMAFATQELVNNATCVFPVENRALLDIARQTKGRVKQETSLYTPFDDLNSIIVNMLLHLTSGSRFPGSLNFDMNELNTNMVPFPKLNFLSTGFNPLPYNNLKNNRKTSKQLKDEIFMASCNRINQLVKLDPLGSKKSVLMCTTLIGRGDFTLTDMRSYIDKIQIKARFAPWSSKAVKVGLCNVPPYNTNLALLSVFNTTSMANLFVHIQGQFSRLYRKKAHVHHYTKIPGFEPDFFEDCNMALIEIIDTYKESENIKAVSIPRLTPFIL